MSAFLNSRACRCLAGAVLLLVCSLLPAALAGCGSTVKAETTQSTPTTASATAAPSATTAPSVAEVPPAAAAETAFFDDSIVHAISVSFSRDDYDAMVDTYETSAEKDWIEATVTIDGVTYQNVGMRLKGNSSLMGLRNNGRQGGPSSGVSAQNPEGLPWLIRLDKNVDGQNHDGVTDLVVRSNTSETSLNEAVALDLLEKAGLASQDAVACRFTVNTSPAVLRLVTEFPGDDWMAETFGSSGALYKAEASGDYSYRGDDPESYDDVFDQEAGDDNADLTPLIAFLDFINNADDQTFNTELPERLDIDSFATYLAMEELVANFDDIDGPGNNSYLYYDPAAGMFTVVPWDHNLAFGGKNGGAGVQGGMQGGMQGGAQGGLAGEGTPSGGQDQRPNGARPGQEAGGRGKSNILVERFHANPGFEALYDQKLATLTEDLLASGLAQVVLDDWVALLKDQAADLVDFSTIEAEAATIAAYFKID